MAHPVIAPRRQARKERLLSFRPTGEIFLRSLFARAQRQRAFRRYGPDFHRRAVVQTRKIFGDLCSLLEATDLEQEKATDRFFGFGKRAVRDGTAFLL